MRTLTWLAAVLAVLLGSAAATGGTSATQLPPRQDYNSGAYLFRAFCASCHGPEGRGDGPAADILRTRPSDLTRIAARNGGTFPGSRVAATIDGRQPTPGHGRQDMPIWGDVLQVTEGQNEAAVRKRIEALVTHLEGMQMKGGDMSKHAGVWIDHKQAIIVSDSAGHVSAMTLASGVEPHPRYGGQQDGGGEKKYEGRHREHLDRYYDEVIAHLRQPESLLIFGPGEAKLELEERLSRSKTLPAPVVEIETADKLTDPEIVAKFKAHYGLDR